MIIFTIIVVSFILESREAGGVSVGDRVPRRVWYLMAQSGLEEWFPGCHGQGMD